jgi:hypothetical protein
MNTRRKSIVLWGTAILILISINVIGGIFALNPSVFGPYETWHEIYNDCDKLNDDEYIVAAFPLAGLPLLGSINQNLDCNRIYIINSSSGEMTWEYTGLYFPHEVQLITSGITSTPAFLVANAAMGGVDQISYPGKTLEWQWLPELINWTEVNPLWGEDADINNPNSEFGHYIVNDVDFINGSDFGENFDSIMISIKKFCLVAFVNYTREMEEAIAGDKFGNASNIYWTFGNNGTDTVLNQQHNPDMMPNGNLLISDSDNERVIEVNVTTKEIIWEQKQAGGLEFSIAKDVDYIPATDTFLVTDTGNNRVLEMDRDGNIIWSYQDPDFMVPYESDLLPNGNILSSGGGSGVFIEFNPTTKQVIWRFNINGYNSIEPNHINFALFIVILNPIGIAGLLTIGLIGRVKSQKPLVAQAGDSQDPKAIKKQKDYRGDIALYIFVISLYILLLVFGKPFIYYLSAMLMRFATAINPIMPGFN